MKRFALLLALLVVVSATRTLNYNQLISGRTRFEYKDGGGPRNVTFMGFTIRENIVCEDGAGSGNYLIFERPNLRYNGPYDARYAAWYNLSLDESTLGAPYMPGAEGTYDMSLIDNQQIYGPDAVIIECKKDPARCVRVPDQQLTMQKVTASLILRGGMKENFNAGDQAVMVSDLLARLSNDNSRSFPLGVVGGCVRDFLASDVAGINDIDAQEYTQIGYRLKDIFVDWNQPIDDSVLDRKGIRKEFGLLKIRPQTFPEPPVSCDSRIDFVNEKCYADGLDIGPFKGSFNMSTVKTYAGSGRSLTEEESINHYVYAYSYAMDGRTRDFTINTIYYDFAGDVFIDPTGKGIEDSENLVLRIADPLTACDGGGCPWRMDLGGWFRYWRFIAEPTYIDKDTGNPVPTDGKGYNLPENGDQITVEHVCQNLNKAMCRIIQSATGQDEFLQYNAYSFFLKLRKKRKFTATNVGVLLKSWRDQLHGFPGDRCTLTWNLLTQLAASPQTTLWTHLLEGSPETTLVLEIIDYLSSQFVQSDESLCDLISTETKSAHAPLVPVAKSASVPLPPDMITNFKCFMDQYILSESSYSGSDLVWSTGDDTRLLQDNPLTLVDYEYYYATGFEDASLPVAFNSYPRWTDLEIVVASELARPVYVHKLVLLLVYPRVPTLSPNSQLGQYVQAMLAGDQQSLSRIDLILSDVSYSVLMRALDVLYAEAHWEPLLQSMSDWRYQVSSGDEIALAQWNSLGGSRIISAQRGLFVPVSRFFLASFCHEDGVRQLALLSRSRDLFWEVEDQRLANSQDIERALDLMSWENSALNSNSSSADAQKLAYMATAGDFFCTYHEANYSPNSLIPTGLITLFLVAVAIFQF